MKSEDMAVVAGMTTENLIRLIRDAVPDKKDTMRAEDVCKLPNSHWDSNRGCYVDSRKIHANKQLKAITDTKKFYRRAKAFLLKEIDISLSGTIFYKQNEITAQEFFKNYKGMVKQNRETVEALDVLD
jgi:hypothetical protein